jgi:hypothetical protein
VSPFLERWRASPDPSLIAFADELRNYGGRGGLAFLLLAAKALGARPSTGILGLGVLSPVLAPWRNASARRLLGAAATATALDLVLGQWTPRFFLEPCWWSIAAIGLRERPIPTGWLTVAAFQASLTACGAVVCAALLFPGTWSERSREGILRSYAPGYEEARWLDRILQPDDVLLTGIGSTVFLPRPFILDDRFDGLRPAEDEQRELRWLERDAGVSVMTVASDDDLSPAIAVEAKAGEPIGPPMRSHEVTRKDFGLVLLRRLWPAAGEQAWPPQPDFELQAVRLAR